MTPVGGLVLGRNASHGRHSAKEGSLAMKPDLIVEVRQRVKSNDLEREREKRTINRLFLDANFALNRLHFETFYERRLIKANENKKKKPFYYLFFVRELKINEDHVGEELRR